jgi:hypothetical protein
MRLVLSMGKQRRKLGSVQRARGTPPRHVVMCMRRCGRKDGRDCLGLPFIWTFGVLAMLAGYGLSRCGVDGGSETWVLVGKCAFVCRVEK